MFNSKLFLTLLISTAVSAQAATDSFGAEGFEMKVAVLIDGACTVSNAGEVKTIPVHSENSEKLILGFSDGASRYYRLEIVNNSGTALSRNEVLQVAIDDNNFLKNPPLLCPVSPEDFKIECEKENAALYPSHERMTSLDNPDGIAFADGMTSAGYRKVLKRGNVLLGETVRFLASKRIGQAAASCDLTVTLSR